MKLSYEVALVVELAVVFINDIFGLLLIGSYWILQNFLYNHVLCTPFCCQLYELGTEPERKEFLDDLFSFMQKRGELFCRNVSKNTIFMTSTPEQRRMLDSNCLI